jgi:hypothetical protein
MHNELVPRRDQNLLSEIQRDALDERTSLAATLRKCIMLGSQVSVTLKPS